MHYISNAFSLNMIPKHCSIRIFETDAQSAQNPHLYSIVGHKETAERLGVKLNRESITLRIGDTLIVAQYSGPRLEEGATSLPITATFRWFHVTIF